MLRLILNIIPPIIKSHERPINRSLQPPNIGTRAPIWRIPHLAGSHEAAHCPDSPAFLRISDPGHRAQLPYLDEHRLRQHGGPICIHEPSHLVPGETYTRTPGLRHHGPMPIHQQVHGHLHASVILRRRVPASVHPVVVPDRLSRRHVPAALCEWLFGT